MQIATINADGTMNFHTVEAMVVVEFANTIAMMSGSKTNISLDVRGSYTPMEEPKITQPSPTPRAASSQP
jgi:hypothetical protein